MNIGIIGLGSVGGAIATAVHNTGVVREMVLFDRDPARSYAAAEDLGHASIFGFNVDIRSGQYSDFKGCDIVIIAAGANQKPGETRTDLLQKNAVVIQDIIPKLMRHADKKKVVLIIVSNPLDVMTKLAAELSGLPAGRVIGTGTMLDSARFKIILSRQLGVSATSLHAMILGEHGDSSVAAWSAVRIGGLELDEFCRQTKHGMTAATKKTIERRVKTAAYEIIKGRGATWDGIGAAAADLVRCVARDERRILTVSLGDGSLPRIVGGSGVAATLHPKLDRAETAALKNSFRVIDGNWKKL
ncbi:MAG: NAD(P)-binding domain-containing protein [Rickettsiales bacterium]|jgi:L-lactate dehydrogenase|nr:NAD(P)-binding domain-containing protein [Rickettsiales bacterium]